MSGKDPELSQLGDELSRARAAYTEAKLVTDGAKEHLNATGDQIQEYNVQIADLKKSVDLEYDQMRALKAEGDREGAEEHRRSAQALQEALSAKYEEKKQCFARLDEARAAFNVALDGQKALRDEMQAAWDKFNQRLEYLKAQNEIERAKWLETTCKECGKKIRYHKDRKKAPVLCRECYEKDKVNWEDRQCARCGADFRININWEHIPSICPDCRKKLAEEKERRAMQERDEENQTAPEERVS